MLVAAVVGLLFRLLSEQQLFPFEIRGTKEQAEGRSGGRKDLLTEI